MPSVGYYSIEVQITNNTQTNFAIQAAVTDGSNDSWMSGEQPTVGNTLNQGQSLVAGVSTTDQNGLAGGYVSMTGLEGSKVPVAVTFQIPPGQSGVSVTGPTSFLYMTRQISTGEDNHVQYQVIITTAPPQMARASARA